ncbi:F-box/WD repeat-containing protein 7 [Holothuria leucospilota]|uniref:F-box/WD repeat-containing protein 7 n=1 Tax=Holothuria leucospilota TaxID=206669 RepID=A0A9Q1CHB5_HOLLE|nr:F-box/WD repeat-containing protein 7 [Holothuria leucospilota]
MDSVERAAHGNNDVLLTYERRMLVSGSTESLCNKHFFKTVCSWFEVWMPWQRRVLLCGVTSRCTRQQLEYLATAMEPVFHRDFVTSLHGLYPIRSMSRRKGILSRSYVHKPCGSASYFISGGKSRPVMGNAAMSSLDEYAQMYVQSVVQSALERLHSEELKVTSEDYRSQEEFEEKQAVVGTNEDHDIDPVKASSTPSLPKVTSVNKPTLGRANHSSRTISKNLTTANILTQPRTVLPPVMEISSTSLLTSGTSPERGSLSHSRQSLKRPSFHERFGTFPPDNVGHILSNHDIDESNFPVTNLSGKLTPDGTLNQLSSRRLSTFTWCMDHQLMESRPTSKASVKSESSSHKHRSRSSSVTASTQDFFPSEKLHKLGTYHGVLRTGKVKHPCHVQEIPVSLQRAYKPSRLWDNEKIKKKQELVRANKSTLKQHFKDQIESIWEWMSRMEDHDKAEFLAELLKKCDQGLLKFFSKCLAKRLEECSNINDLSDKLLLDIFSFLPVEDLNSARLVCRRWYYIASHDEIWRLKVLELGASEGIQNLDEMLLYFTKNNSIDWKVAYEELSTVIANAKKFKTPQQKLLQVKEKLRNFFEYRVREFLDRIRPKHVEVDEESSSSDSPPPQDDMKAERTASGVVELPVTFMATTQSQIDAITGMGDDDKKTQTPQEESSKDDRKAAAERRAMRRQEMLRGADFALDVRPDPVQAEDLLVKKPSAGTGGLHKVYPARNDGIKPIKRVRRLQGHMDAVCTLMFDKRRIITGSMDHSIRVWDIRSGRSIKKIYGHLGGIRCLQFSEKFIVSGSWDMSVRVWDIIRFTEVAVMTGHSGVVSCLQFNSKYLVTGSHDKSMRVWSMDDFSCRSILKHHSSAVTCLVFHDQFVVSGSTDRLLACHPTGQ